jgi:hypothetical protein
MLPVRHLGVALVIVLFLVAMFVGAWSCGWLPQGVRNGSVAVVDIESVAKQLGADVALDRQIKDAEASLNSQLASLQAALRKQYEDKSRELLAPRDNRPLEPAEATAAKQQLAEIEKTLNRQLLQAQQTARDKFNVYRVGLAGRQESRRSTRLRRRAHEKRRCLAGIRRVPRHHPCRGGKYAQAAAADEQSTGPRRRSFRPILVASVDRLHPELKSASKPR